ncbi:hypothetical protein JZU57_02660, partial [bacterium]|nr:hypothetical protein [bacterium]
IYISTYCHLLSGLLLHRDEILKTTDSRRPLSIRMEHDSALRNVQKTSITHTLLDFIRVQVTA